MALVMGPTEYKRALRHVAVRRASLTEDNEIPGVKAPANDVAEGDTRSPWASGSQDLCTPWGRELRDWHQHDFRASV